MAILFTSDTHFGHSNIIKYCGRPYKNVEQMNEDLIRRWNGVVQKDDTVFHLGDFSFKGYKRFRERLNGNIIIVRGNHDNDEITIIREINIKLGGKDWVLTHVPPEAQKKDFCLCGHVHEKWKTQKKGNKLMINVGVDVWNFTPITIKDILTECAKIKKQ